jgi:hypothetical protein
MISLSRATFPAHSILPVITLNNIKLGVHIMRLLRITRGLFYAGFGILTGAIMKSPLFWDVTEYSPLKVNRGFGGIIRLHI